MAQRFERPRMAGYAVGIACAALLAGNTAVIAQKKPAKGAETPADPATEKAAEADAARKAYGSGLAAYQSGKYDTAVQSLSVALRGGGLASPEMAKALYTRGLAYRSTGKTAQAISDLTSAVWLKNGLSDADRSEAIAARSEAYREAGITETAVTVASGAPSSGARSAAAAKPAASGSSSGSFFSNLFSSSPPATISENAAAAGQPTAQPSPAPRASVSGVPAPIPTEGSPVAGFGETSVTTAATASPAGDAYRPASGFSGSDSTAAAAPASQSQHSEGGIGGFFSNMFGGSSATTQESATAAPEASGFTTSSTTPQPATSSWDSSTQVVPSSQSPDRRAGGVRTAALDNQTAFQTAVKTPPPAPALKGKYKMHIAAVRSRDEAEGIAAKLLAEHGSALDSRRPMVDEAVIGSMGTFYRVRVAPYRTADEARETCKSLKSGGFDCLVVTK